MVIPVFPMEQGVTMGVRFALYHKCTILGWDGTGQKKTGNATWVFPVILFKLYCSKIIFLRGYRCLRGSKILL